MRSIRNERENRRSLSLTTRITRSYNYVGTIDTVFSDLDNWNESIFCLFGGWLCVTIRSCEAQGEMYKGNIARVDATRGQF